MLKHSPMNTFKPRRHEKASFNFYTGKITSILFLPLN